MPYDTALWPLQEAIYQKLEADVSLKNMITGVFDAVPKDQAYPYVVIGEPAMLPFDTKTVPGEEISLVIHAWSDYPGKKETFNILNACQKALSYKLDLPGFWILKVERLGIQVFDDIDPRIRHGVLRMKYTLRSE
ncbi:DUF3168 domain-containing protein [Bacillus sp. ISL-35]|uniref:DUF3168 domain-containing protein n=1 Tax=Bacillus sp. ISL-35 TaxID=2819122 RepID=UPI001BE69B2C|nr:DUF3168 domain-containing protein [Bacillus sp. ISL-35]MBT2680052.1 DUF3168 domain-containing protein [Bacillus sp. ISL-35]MBT2702971.1 DUF3168 domain-containing protein [Chryseobacterium sp. ISL-80]